jgi:hypothetical protein
MSNFGAVHGYSGSAESGYGMPAVLPEGTIKAVYSIPRVAWGVRDHAWKKRSPSHPQGPSEIQEHS